MTVNVYYSRDEMICAAARVIPKTQQVGAAAMKALLEGPTDVEEEAGMVTNIPAGTTFLGLAIDDGVATVDLSKEYASGGGSLSMMMRLAEVVFTLTQFPTVEGVNFKLDGEPIDVLGGEGLILDHPMSRADYEDLSPAILVESPTVGNTVEQPAARQRHGQRLRSGLSHQYRRLGRPHHRRRGGDRQLRHGDPGHLRRDDPVRPSDLPAGERSSCSPSLPRMAPRPT